MAREFKETAHLKTDEKKFKERFDEIDWGDLKDKPVEKKNNKKHSTAGMCGEYGMSAVDEEKFKENFDNIDWNKKKE